MTLEHGPCQNCSFLLQTSALNSTALFSSACEKHACIARRSNVHQFRTKEKNFSHSRVTLGGNFSLYSEEDVLTY